MYQILIRAHAHSLMLHTSNLVRASGIFTTDVISRQFSGVKARFCKVYVDIAE